MTKASMKKPLIDKSTSYTLAYNTNEGYTELETDLTLKQAKRYGNKYSFKPIIVKVTKEIVIS
jgi:hypothetical protein